MFWGQTTVGLHETYLRHGLLGKADVVDGNGVAPSEVLARARQECLGEKKAGNPENWRWFVPQPPIMYKGAFRALSNLQGCSVNHIFVSGREVVLFGGAQLLDVRGTPRRPRIVHPFGYIGDVRAKRARDRRVYDVSTKFRTKHAHFKSDLLLRTP